MTDLAKLMEVMELAATFKKAVEAKAENEGLQAQMMATVNPAEMEEVIDLVQEVADASLGAMLGSITPEFAELNLKLADKTVEIAQRVLSKDDLAAMVPAELKTEENLTVLEQHSAPRLAALCR